MCTNIKRFDLFTEDCHFYYPYKDKYILVEIKDNKIYVNNHWKEIRLYKDGFTNFMDSINMMCRNAYEDLFEK